MKHLIYLNFHSNLKHSINQSQNDKNQLRNEIIDLLQHYDTTIVLFSRSECSRTFDEIVNSIKS
jgi:hypothetical protein